MLLSRARNPLELGPLSQVLFHLSLIFDFFWRQRCGWQRMCDLPRGRGTKDAARRHCTLLALG